jgi:hypothetical protein
MINNKNLEYKVTYDDTIVKCKTCNIHIRNDSLDRHKRTKKHLNKLKQQDNIKVKKTKKAPTLAERCRRDKEYKKKHMDYISQKIKCENCGSEIIRTSLYRHRKSMKCMLFNN